MNNATYSQGERSTPPKTRRSQSYLYLAAYLTVLVMVMLTVVEEQRNLYGLGYEIVDLRIENKGLRESRDRLQEEKAQLTAPDRVVEESIRLGLRLVPTENRQEVQVTQPPKLESHPVAKDVVSLREDGA